MKVSYKALAAALTLAFSSSALADWNLSASYNNFSDDTDGIDISMGAVTAGVGYKYEYPNSKFSVMPELRIGTGVKDDDFVLWYGDMGLSATVEIKTFTALSVRGQYEISDSVSVFVQPVYANLDVEVSLYGESASDDEWDFGVGAGLIARANEQYSFEVSYERFDETDVISAGVRYHF
ncbi:outer membrane beta-barrel protein [Alteromonas antoniana]|uniref:outer membrane beta-barrel protein n=1 Tax=Alteromonas antoniana TaxID=2803813 RepID=UPI001C482DAD|nr:outer membrane beta-barrel protein [Alteromonas antoniana]